MDIVVSSVCLYVDEEGLIETFGWRFRKKSTEMSLNKFYVLPLAFVMFNYNCSEASMFTPKRPTLSTFADS